MRYGLRTSAEHHDDRPRALANASQARPGFFRASVPGKRQRLACISGLDHFYTAGDSLRKIEHFQRAGLGSEADRCGHGQKNLSVDVHRNIDVTEYDSLTSPSIDRCSHVSTLSA